MSLTDISLKFGVNASEVGLFVVGLLILVGYILYRDYKKEKHEHKRFRQVLSVDQEVRYRFGRGRN